MWGIFLMYCTKSIVYLIVLNVAPSYIFLKVRPSPNTTTNVEEMKWFLILCYIYILWCYFSSVPLEPILTRRNSKIPKGQTEIVTSENRQEHGQQNETKHKHRTHNTTLKTKAGVTRTLQKPGLVQVLRKGEQLLLN